MAIVAEKFGIQVDVKAGTIIYDIGENISSVLLILKGRMVAKNAYSKTTIEQGNFVGINELYVGKYTRKVVADTDCVVCVYNMDSPEMLSSILKIGKVYSNLVLDSLMVQLSKYVTWNKEFDKVCERLFDTIMDMYDLYNEQCQNIGVKAIQLSNIEELDVIQMDNSIDKQKLLYYQNMKMITKGVKEEYFGESEYICLYHIADICMMINELQSICQEQMEYILINFENLISAQNDNIFLAFIKTGLEVAATGDGITDIVDIIKKILIEANKYNQIVMNITGIEIIHNKKRISELYEIIGTRSHAIQRNGTEDTEQVYLEYTNAQVEQAFLDTANSMNKIIAYGELEEEKAKQLVTNVNQFKKLKDKYASSPEVTSIRQGISKIFYELYEGVFFKYMDTKDDDRVIDMFLTYGFLDEKLLEREQVIDLYYLQHGTNEGRVKVYTIKDWLMGIYRGEIETSKNEFDLDYVESLRELKKTQHMTPQQEKEYLSDYKAMVKFETANMFRSNHRLCTGQISVFVPVLHKDMFIKDMRKSMLTPDIINNTIDNILQIDYSAFYREVVYSNAEKNIGNELIMKEVMPKVILMPTFGTVSQMWQEIEGRRKDTSARFMMPFFAGEDVQTLVIKLMGRYRWEICRRIMGYQWNDVTQKSLTSIYSDYIQYYRKNNELSEAAKEKLKNQIQRARNNLREIFVVDYEAWVKYESQGGVRLNKVARDILFQYCPLEKSIRTKLSEVPTFTQTAAKYNRLKTLKIKEVTNRYTSVYKNNGGKKDDVLEGNLVFYRDL